SEVQLDVLRVRAREAGVDPSIQTVHGSMLELADLVAAGNADVVLAPFRCLLHVTPERDTVFRQVYDALRPGGVFAFGVFHPTPATLSGSCDRWIHRRNERTTSGKWRFAERMEATTVAGGVPGEVQLRVDVRCRWRPHRRMKLIPGAALHDPPADSPHERHAR